MSLLSSFLTFTAATPKYIVLTFRVLYAIMEQQTEERPELIQLLQLSFY